MRHITRSEVIRYIDGETDPEESQRISEHLKLCDECSKAVEEAQTVTKLLNEAGENQIVEAYGSDCLDANGIAEYVEGNVSVRKRETIEKHLSFCARCLDTVTTVKKQIQNMKHEQVPESTQLSTLIAVRKQLRKSRLDAVLSNMDVFVKSLPSKVTTFLESAIDTARDTMKRSFSYPAPSLAPLFGTAESEDVYVTSPLGKVRYPIVFEWTSCKGADIYEISIEEIGWKVELKTTRYFGGRNELELEYGKEYMWRFRAITSDSVLSKLYGFFTMLGKEESDILDEAEDRISLIESEIDRVIIWAGILESMNLYVDAISRYKYVYEIQSLPGLAFRIASCYDELGLEKFREEWNKKIEREDDA